MNFLTDQQFTIFRNIIYKESGIHFSEINRPILESRIKERLRVKNLELPDDYYNLVNTNQSEMKLLLDSVTTNLTKFFRNEAHFDALRDEILKEIITRKIAEGKKAIKIWSAGCSTGEEPYTILMVILDVINDFQNWKIEILASDISLKSLLIAKEGYYSKEKLDNLPPATINKYFDTFRDGYKVKELLKKFIRFDYHNLIYDNGERNLDIIFCRNVIIYFDKTAQEAVIKRFFTCLNDDGYLFIGHSESLFGMQSGFKFHKIANACVYRKK